MFYADIVVVNSQHVYDAKSYFNHEYIQALQKKSMFQESLTARYLISKIVSSHIGKKFIPSIIYSLDKQSKTGIFRSISHKKGILGIAVSTKPIGIDIEFEKQRSDMFYESILGKNTKKDRPMFYRTWTAKEAVLKRFGETISQIQKIHISDIIDTNCSISQLCFDKVFEVLYSGKEYCVYSGKTNLCYIALSYST